MKKLVNLKKVNRELLRSILELFSRDDLRKFAKDNDVPRGQNKSDTIRNLVVDQYDLDVTLMVGIDEPIKS